MVISFTFFGVNISIITPNDQYENSNNFISLNTDLMPANIDISLTERVTEMQIYKVIEYGMTRLEQRRSFVLGNNRHTA